MLKGGGGQSKIVIIFFVHLKVFPIAKSTNIQLLKENSFPVFNLIKLLSQ